MAFESLTERMSQAFKNLTGQGKAYRKKYERHAEGSADVTAGSAMSIIRSSKTLSPVSRRRRWEKRCSVRSIRGRWSSRSFTRRSRSCWAAKRSRSTIRKAGYHHADDGGSAVVPVKTTASAKIANLMKKKAGQKTAARCLRRRASGSDRTAADAGKRASRCRGVYPGRGDEGAGDGPSGDALCAGERL